MTQVKSLIANLRLLDTNLGRTEARLKQLDGGLKDVSKALAISKRVSDDLTMRRKITVPYSIKVKVRKFEFPKFWETFEIQTQNFTFTIEQIINGVNVGIKKVEDLLMQGAMKVLGPVLRPLDNALKKISLDIPGLAQVEGQLSQVLATLTAIGRSLEAIAAKGKAMMDTMARIDKVVGTFNIKCPPA